MHVVQISDRTFEVDGESMRRYPDVGARRVSPHRSWSAVVAYKLREEQRYCLIKTYPQEEIVLLDFLYTRDLVTR